MVKIDGYPQSHKVFSYSRHVAIGFMTDGFQIFKHQRNGSSTCWPLIIINFNLPPEIHTQLSNIIPLAIIPGLKAPINFNSFEQPFMEECKLLAAGVQSFDIMTGQSFPLHVYPISCHGDMVAMKHCMGYKGPNGLHPCWSCMIKGVQGETGPYYIPLNHPWENPSMPQVVWDAQNLPLCTEEVTQLQLELISSLILNSTCQKEYSKKFGINGPSILAEVPSIQMMQSFLHD